MEFVLDWLATSQVLKWPTVVDDATQDSVIITPDKGDLWGVCDTDFGQY